MTDTSETDRAEEPTTGDNDAGNGENDAGAGASEGDDDEAVEQARAAPAGQEERSSRGGGEPSQPQQLLDALGEEIDDVRRRVVDQDAVARAEERFIQEGEADEEEPVDDTIAPPG
ncbi:MAG: hypothetical protein ACRD0N_09615 [Acidimicrobiales bacterium]